MLETCLVKMRWNSGMALLNCLYILRCRCHFILLIVIIALACEIFGAFVLVGWTELEGEMKYQRLCARLEMKKQDTHVLIASKRLRHFTRGVLIQLLVVAKDDNGDIDRTKNGEFMRLLEETTLSLQKRAVQGILARKYGWFGLERQGCESNIHRAIAVIFDRFDLDLSATHVEKLPAHEARAPRGVSDEEASRLTRNLAMLSQQAMRQLVTRMQDRVQGDSKTAEGM